MKSLFFAAQRDAHSTSWNPTKIFWLLLNWFSEVDFKNVLFWFYWSFAYDFQLRLISGSLPPSPADSGVSDVDSSSSGNGQPICSDEIKARLGLSGTTATPNNSGQQQTQLPPHTPGTFLHPNFYHQSAPLRNLWNNRNVSCEYLCIRQSPLISPSICRINSDSVSAELPQKT